MQSRINRLLSAVPDGRAVFISSRPNLFYYSGFTSDEAWLIISSSQRFLITDARYTIQAKLEAPDFDIIDSAKGWEKIFAIVSAEELCFEEQKVSFAFFEEISKKAAGKRFFKAQRQINEPRRCKDSSELRLIAQAENLGDMAFSHIIDYIRPGRTEREIALELELYMKRQGASDLSFTTIAASGVRSAMPHGAASDKLVENGDLLTLDFGCVYKGYCSDMTRTVVLGTADSRQKEIYDVVLRAQQAALDGIYCGMPCSEADKLARDVIREAGYGENFGHSLGHSVGIEIHEMPCFSSRSKDILTEGNVLSVEPGIYIDGWGGVRIEDLIAIVDGNIVNLTNSPKNLMLI